MDSFDQTRQAMSFCSAGIGTRIWSAATAIGSRLSAGRADHRRVQREAIATFGHYHRHCEGRRLMAPMGPPVRGTKEAAI